MTRRIYGQILHFEPDAGGYLGLRVANQGFLQALLQHGGFDEVHLFLTDRVLSRFTAPPAPPRTQVRILPVRDLPRALAEVPYSVFHAGDPYIHHLAHLRQAYAPQPFPITGITHSLSLDPAMKGFVDVTLSPHYPFDGIVCTSNHGRDALKGLFAAAVRGARAELRAHLGFRGSLEVIPLGIDTGAVSDLDRRAARAALDLPADRPILLCLGRICPSSKMDLYPLLLALAELVARPRTRDVLLVLGGSIGGAANYLETLIERAAGLGLTDHLHFLFDFDDERKQQLLRAADVFVSIADNVQETFGIAPVEAMAAGLPVVLSDWSGYRELVVADESGLLVPTYWQACDEEASATAFYRPMEAHFDLAQSVAVDVPSLTAALSQVLGDPERCRAMGEAARARAVQRFDWQPVIAAYLRFWQRLSRRAAKAEWRGPTGEHGSLPYFHVFNHYAGHLLGDGDGLSLTERGRRVLTGQEQPRAYRGLQDRIHLGLVHGILTAADGGIRIGELKAVTANPSLLDSHLLWLLKNHLLHVQTAA